MNVHTAQSHWRSYCHIKHEELQSFSKRGINLLPASQENRNLSGQSSQNHVWDASHLGLAFWAGALFFVTHLYRAQPEGLNLRHNLPPVSCVNSSLVRLDSGLLCCPSELTSGVHVRVLIRRKRKSPGCRDLALVTIPT